MIPLRTIYKTIEPIILAIDFPVARDVILKLVDPVSDTVVLDDVAMTELAEAPGVYVKSFSVEDLDAVVVDGEPFVDKLLLWVAGVDPEDENVPPYVGSIYRGGHVDEWVRSRPFSTFFAGVDIPARSVKAGMIDKIEYPLPHGQKLRVTFTYRAMSGDVASVATEILPA